MPYLSYTIRYTIRFKGVEFDNLCQKRPGITPAFPIIYSVYRNMLRYNLLFCGNIFLAEKKHINKVELKVNLLWCQFLHIRKQIYQWLQAAEWFSQCSL